MRKLLSVLALVSAVLFVVTADAQAAPITLGSSLTGTFETSSCGNPCSLLNLTVTGPNPVKSPVTGAIIRWQVIGASAVPGYAIRVLRPTSSGGYTGVGTSLSETPTGPAQQSFQADLPIQAGDLVGIDEPEDGDLPINHSGGQYGGFEPLLGEGETEAVVGPFGGELGYNAEVQPAPTITVVATTTGPTAGGTSVLITGTDLEGTTAVKFGGSAAIFGQVSETAVLATSPAAASAGNVPISVTTLAGSASASQQFTYSAPAGPPAPTCTVPKLKGTKLAAAKKKIKAASCKVGKVTKEKSPKAKKGKVVGQGTKAGKVVPVGTAVKLTVGNG